MKNKITMDYLIPTERLNYLLEMIEKGQLLSFKQASEKYGCSQRTIIRMLNALRERGHDIYYCKTTEKYSLNK